MNWGFDQLGRIKRLEFTAVAAAAIAIACVLIGQSAERYAASSAPSQIAIAAAAKANAETHGAPIFNTIDYATTGSIKGQTVVISPCTGREVER